MNILIAEDEVELIEIIEFLVQDFFPEKVTTFLAKNSVEAIEVLTNNSIDLCISDHNMPGGNGSKILKYIMQNNLSISFVLSSTVTPQELPNEYPIDNVLYHIQKPDVISGVKALSAIYKLQKPESAAVMDLEMIFIPVSLHFVLLLEKAPSDLYIRISDSKYLKCLNGGEPFGMDDNAKYLSKSVSKLYVKKPSNEELLTQLLSAAISKLMKKSDLPLNEKMSIIHAQICDLIQFTGMSEEIAAITKENVNQTVSIIMKNNLLDDFWKGLNLMGEYPSQLYTLHSMLASVVVKKLSWSSEATMFKLTLAAFFQDITLTNLSLVKVYDHQHFLEIKADYNNKEIKNYIDHPLKAHDIIVTMKGIPADIDKIILEQHEMPDGSGFPRKLNANQLGPLSCLFILCGLLARFILNEGENFAIDNFIDKFEALGYNKGNFKDSFNVIKKFTLKQE
ncbi:MAG: response regulator [Bacteriovorax sp.]|nr:response regulator [Bacteriovorax sp.]